MGDDRHSVVEQAAGTGPSRGRPPVAGVGRAETQRVRFLLARTPSGLPRGDVIVRLDERALALKIDALRAHSSQMEPLFDAYGEEFLRTVAATEVFRSGPRPAFRSRMLSDLSGRSI